MKATTIAMLQHLDAGFLLCMSLCTLVVLQRDLHNASFLIRAPTAAVGFFCFSQAMFLLGVYIPGAAGFPWPRIALDGSMFVATLVRTVRPSLFPKGDYPSDRHPVDRRMSSR